jgi:signal transduction histidine kinase
VIFLSGLNVAAIFVGIAFRARRAYLNQLVENARQEQIQRASEVQIAASQERTRIAREMHDIVAHGLSVMTALADGAAVSMRQDPDQAETAMSTVSTVGRQSLREMRRLLGVLRDDSPTGRAPQPGLDRLTDLTEPLRLVGTSVEVQVSGEPRVLPPTEDATAYRIIQESLTNVVKHATGATSVSILIDWAPEKLCLSIRDDGRPEPRGDHAAGHGLAGMAERTALFEGELVAGPVPNGGWQVRATLPLSAVR